MSLPRCEVERGRAEIAPTLLRDVVRSGVQEELCHPDVSCERRKHERGPPHRCARVHVAAPIEDVPDRGRISGKRGRHQRREPTRSRGIRVGASLDQEIDDPGTAAKRRQRQRPETVGPASLGIRAYLQRVPRLDGVTCVDALKQPGLSWGERSTTRRRARRGKSADDHDNGR